MKDFFANIATKTRVILTTTTTFLFAFVFYTTGTAGLITLAGYGSGGGGGSVSLVRDNCPTGDNSSSYYDGICGTAPTTVTLPVAEAPKTNETYTDAIDTVIGLNGSISREKLDQFVKNTQLRVYTRTQGNAERIVSLSAMIRYIERQIELTADTNNKAVLVVLKNRFDSAIEKLRQDIANGVIVTPNRKKNDVSSEVVAVPAGMSRYVNIENPLVVRALPNFKSDATGYLLSNERVEILAIGTNWSQVKTSVVEGYVRTRLLRQTLELLNTDKPSYITLFGAGD